MRGLDPRIHAVPCRGATWMAGSGAGHDDKREPPKRRLQPISIPRTDVRNAGEGPRASAGGSGRHRHRPALLCQRLSGRGHARMSWTMLLSGPRRPAFLALIVACAMFMEQLDGSVIATALPSMAVSLGTTAVRLNLAITAYM